MSNTILLKGGIVVNEGQQTAQDVLVKNGRIEKIAKDITPDNSWDVVELDGKFILPGCIDDQVHFREPGLTHKATIFTESRAAVAGGITSFMEMPNTVPNALTQELLQDKYDIGAKQSLANYSFFMGASNENVEDVLKTNERDVCGVKIFMGSSTGNMLVDSEATLNNLFSKVPMLIATHCEDEGTIRANIAAAKEKYGEDVPMHEHPYIRSEGACYKSSSMAVRLAKKHGTRLHILHISTAKELELFDNTIPLEQKKITAEACIHHMYFSEEQYADKGVYIKWNPAVKKATDRDAIFQGVLDNKIDVIATDHAPHTLEEKRNSYFKAPSGGPLVQHALVAMLQKVKEGLISIERVVEKMAHAPAILFQLEDRGYIREGYYADLVVVDSNKSITVTKENILYKCGWSPFEGVQFDNSIHSTYVNGNLVYSKGIVIDGTNGKRLLFNR
ncbi:MAG: dihydroorotase [Crocinitomicaceae bacterium]|nr:dihydroorotase [Crocinitomicaceae bacterium]MDG1776421.1 dihydroorotase [Crocinitomicaceae bacterium]